jgi:hypothetical protein
MRKSERHGRWVDKSDRYLLLFIIPGAVIAFSFLAFWTNHVNLSASAPPQFLQSAGFD